MSKSQPIRFTRGVPANESFPTDELTDSAAIILEQRGSEILQYGTSYGFPPLREWLAHSMGLEPSQVLTSNGSLQMIEFLCLALLEPGDVVFTESPSYDRALTMLRRHRAKVIGIPIQEDGPEIEALEAELKKRTPKFFYIIPDFQNPSGSTCSLEKRQRIVELANEYDFILLEDAPYRRLRYRGAEQPTLFQLAPGRTLHMSSFSKLIAPGLRVGYIAGDRDIMARMGKVAEDTYISPAYLSEAVAYEWLRRGRLDSHIEELKALYAPRLNACLQAIDRHIPGAECYRPDGGFFVSITFPQGVTNEAVCQAASDHGLILADGRAFFPDGGGENFLRLPFCALTPDEIDEGIRRLAAAIEDLRTQVEPKQASPLPA